MNEQPRAGMRLDHVGITVTDLDRAIAFYQLALSATVSEIGSDHRARWAFLEVDGHEALTLWELSDASGTRVAPGLHHLGFELTDADQLAGTQQRLAEADTPFVYSGIVPHAKDAESGGVFVLDADNLRVEIFADGASMENPAPDPDAPTCGFF